MPRQSGRELKHAIGDGPIARRQENAARCANRRGDTDRKVCPQETELPSGTRRQGSGLSANTQQPAIRRAVAGNALSASNDEHWQRRARRTWRQSESALCAGAGGAWLCDARARLSEFRRLPVRFLQELPRQRQHQGRLEQHPRRRFAAIASASGRRSIGCRIRSEATTACSLRPSSRASKQWLRRVDSRVSQNTMAGISRAGRVRVTCRGLSAITN